MSVEQNESLSQTQLLQLAQQAMQLYPAQYHGDVQLLCQSENATFIIRTDLARFALRIHRPHYHSRLDIESELAWLDALTTQGIAVPQAIAATDGQRLLSLELNPDTQRYAVLFNWIEGSMPTVEVSPTAFQQLGEITARLHQHSKHWQTPATFQRIIWNHDSMVGAEGHWGDWRHAPHLNPQDHGIIEACILEIKSQLQDFGQSAERYGLIHADLRLTNLLLDRDRIGVIDFDDCGMGWFMHDLAAAISFNEHHAAAPMWIEHWLAGYERIGHITAAEYAILPSLIMQRRIQMLAWIGSHANTEMAQSLGDQWANQSIRLCKKYLRKQIPVGV